MHVEKKEKNEISIYGKKEKKINKKYVFFIY